MDASLNAVDRCRMVAWLKERYTRGQLCQMAAVHGVDSLGALARVYGTEPVSRESATEILLRVGGHLLTLGDDWSFSPGIDGHTSEIIPATKLKPTLASIDHRCVRR